MARITAAELDDVSREGLDFVREFFKSGDEVNEKKAKMCLKTLGEGAKRLSIEVNAVQAAYKMAKAANYTPAQFSELVARIASGDMAPETMRALAESRGAPDGAAKGRSKKVA